MNQLLIRFDVRLPKEAYASKLWTLAERDSFLLRPEAGWPLSVDPLVWPSIFFSKIFKDAAGSPYGQIEVNPEIDAGEYWLDLEEMTRYYSAHQQPGIKGCFVGIEIFSGNAA